MSGALEGLTEHELIMLWIGNGDEPEGVHWGAWMSACVESLHGRGLMDRTITYEDCGASITYTTNDAGRALIAKAGG